MCNQEEIHEIRDSVKENTRALRGSNGDGGMIADVSNIKRDVAEIKDNHLAHLKSDLQAELLLLETRLMAYIDKKFSDKDKSVMDSWVKPIILPLIIAYLVIWFGLN